MSKELPSERRERLLLEELRSVRRLMAALAEAELRPANPNAVPISLRTFALGLARLIDNGIERVAS